MRVGLRAFVLIVTLISILAATIAMRSRSSSMHASLDASLRAEDIRNRARETRLQFKRTQDRLSRVAPARVPPEWAAKCKLQILTAAKVEEIPAEGRGLVQLGQVADGLWIRIFDDESRRIAEVPPDFFKDHTPFGQNVQLLRERLEKLAPPHTVTDAERVEIITEATALVNACGPIAASALARSKAYDASYYDEMIDEAERLEALARP